MFATPASAVDYIAAFLLTLLALLALFVLEQSFRFHSPKRVLCAFLVFYIALSVKTAFDFDSLPVVPHPSVDYEAMSTPLPTHAPAEVLSFTDKILPLPILEPPVATQCIDAGIPTGEIDMYHEQIAALCKVYPISVLAFALALLSEATILFFTFSVYIAYIFAHFCLSLIRTSNHNSGDDYNGIKIVTSNPRDNTSVRTDSSVSADGSDSGYPEVSARSNGNCNGDDNASSLAADCGSDILRPSVHRALFDPLRVPRNSSIRSNWHYRDEILDESDIEDQEFESSDEEDFMDQFRGYRGDIPAQQRLIKKQQRTIFDVELRCKMLANAFKRDSSNPYDALLANFESTRVENRKAIDEVARLREKVKVLKNKRAQLRSAPVDSNS